MAVHVDEAGQHVVTAEVHLVTTLAQLRPPFLVDRHARIADVLDVDDAVAFDHDVDRADWRCAGAADQGRAAQDQLLVGAFALAAIGRGGHGERGGCRVVFLGSVVRRLGLGERWQGGNHKQ